MIRLIAALIGAPMLVLGFYHSWLWWLALAVALVLDMLCYIGIALGYSIYALRSAEPTKPWQESATYALSKPPLCSLIIMVMALAWHLFHRNNNKATLFP